MRHRSSPSSSPLTRVPSPRADQPFERTAFAPRGWVIAAAGISSGVAVVSFMVLPWPTGLLVLPALAAWALLLSVVNRPTGWKQRAPVLVLVGVSAFVLGGLLLILLALLGP